MKTTKELEERSAWLEKENQRAHELLALRRRLDLLAKPGTKLQVAVIDEHGVSFYLQAGPYSQSLQDLAAEILEDQARALTAAG